MASLSIPTIIHGDIAQDIFHYVVRNVNSWILANGIIIPPTYTQFFYDIISGALQLEEIQASKSGVSMGYDN